jgi:hypothetical protein
MFRREIFLALRIQRMRTYASLDLACLIAIPDQATSGLGGDLGLKFPPALAESLGLHL